MSDLIPKKDEIDALIESYFVANNISVDKDIDKIIKDHVKNQIDLYKAMTGIVNPYTLYNNQDRFLNLSLRYRRLSASNTPRDWWATNVRHDISVDPSPENRDLIVNDAKHTYAIRYDQLSGYLWASTAILGIGYSINSQPGIIGKSINSSTYEDKRYFSDAEWFVAITRSSVNAVIETSLVVANYYRYKPLPNNQNINGINENDFQQNENQDQVWDIDVEAPYSQKDKRIIAGGLASVGFAVTALLGVAMASARVAKVYIDKDTTANDKATAVIGLSAITFNTLANLYKTASSYYLFAGNTVKSDNAGYWGSVFGIANGLANIAAISILISELDGEDEKEPQAVLISAMILQVFFGATQLGANAKMASLIADGSRTSGALARPLGFAFLAGALGTINITEIYALVQQSKYANRLQELGKTLQAEGYDGGNYLYEIYGKKFNVDMGIFVSTTVITLIGLGVQFAYLGASTTASYAASGFGLVTNLIGTMLKGVQQELIEDIARDYRNLIVKSPGGSFEFFSKETLASYRLMINNPKFQKELTNIQTGLGVDSIVGVTTMKMTPMGLELAAFTRLAAELDTAGFYIDRFVDGKVTPDQTISLDPKNGIIDLNLAGQRPGNAGNTQLLTFLTPLMAPGEEKRTRVKTGKDSYYIALEIISQGHSWTINDGAMNTLMDVQNVVTSLYDINGALKFSVPLILNGDAGDDTVFAGASNTTFNGGNDVDTMSYASLSASSSISVAALDPTKTDSAFTVHKKIKDENTYKEVIASQRYSVGKRTEVVEYRDIVVDPNTSAFHEADDTLNDVEIISGSNGNDTFSGNAAQNIFRGEAGHDTLHGMAGDDVLSGGSGNDELNGGEGNDAVLYMDNPGGGSFGIKAILESLVQPSNPVQVGGVAAIYGTVEEQWLPTGAGVGGAYPNQTVDQLISIENLAGSDFADDITGSRVANLLSGGKGDDRIDGMAGEDTVIGNEGNDSLSGGEGDDYFVQHDSNSSNYQDTIDGGAGNDIVDYSAGGSGQNSTLSINANLLSGRIIKNWEINGLKISTSDTVRSIEKVIGNVRNDIIAGDAGNNEFLGLDGEDTLNGGDGNDSLAGGLDNDTLRGDAGDDLLLGQIGNDLLTGGAGSDTLQGGNGLDTLSGDDGIDWANFSDVSGLGSDGVWAILKEPQEAPGTAVFGHWSAAGFITKAGINTQLVSIENLSGTRNTDYLIGNSIDNLLDGSSGDDRIEGKAGNDRLIGSAGADDMEGGDGNDTFLQDFDTVNDTIKGGAGSNTVNYSLVQFAPLTNGSGTTNGSGSQLPSRVGVPESTGISADLVTGRIDKFPGSTIAGFHGIDILTDIQTVVGSVLNDTITGNAEVNILYGAAGDDSINASDGEDLIDGGGGNDTLMGGSGDDVLFSDEGSDVVNGEDDDDLFIQSFEYKNDTLDGGAGYDRLSYKGVIFDATKITDEYRHGIEADLSNGLVYKFHLLAPNKAELHDRIRNIEGLIGTSLNDSLTGDEKNNYLSGIDGVDTIKGGAGNDVIEAGNGDDLVHGDDGNDHVKQDLDSSNNNTGSGNDTLDGGEGIDKLDYSLGFLTDARITARLGLGITVELGLGKVWKLSGNTSNNVDTVSNFEQIICTAWKDHLYGDANNNHFDAKEGNDTIDSREGNDFLEAGYGDDNAMGGSGDDTISGDQGNDTLSGQAGNDLFAQHLIRENDIIDGGDGIDKINYSITTFNSGTRAVMGNVGIHANLTTGRIDKFEVDAATGFDSVSNVENIIATNFEDTIIGNALDNFLEGAAGNDVIRGEDGNDVLSGSSGNDTLDGGNGDDFFAAGPGNDLLIGRAGSDFYEILSNSGNDVVEDLSTGTDAGDVIEFKDGIVSDDLWFSRNADNLIISILGSAHTVTVKDWFLGASHQLEFIRTADGKQLTNIQVATLLDSMASHPVPANGNSVPRDVSNVIIATWELPPAAASAATAPSTMTTTTETAQASSTLTPQRSSSARTPLSWMLVGDGDDNDFTGQAGNDSFDGSAGNDTIDGGAGNDSIDGGINVDILLASDDDALFGNEGNDTLNGGSGNDLLSGGMGADLIQGGQGNDIILQEMNRRIDTIHGGDGVDLISYSSNADVSDSRADLGGTGIRANLTTGRIDKFEAGSVNGFDVVSGIENVVGSALDDSIMGGSGSNLVGGGAGDDVLQGFEGHDSLYGGAGQDTLTGGAGNDLIDGEAGNDRIRQELMRENDSIIGGGSNDFLDYSLTNSSTGLREEMGSAGITGDLATGRFDKFEADAAIGFDTVSDMDNVIGSFFHDEISGDWFNNFLAGLSGNDTLRGRAGFDTLDGGLGNDLLEGGEDNDLINGGEGNDRIVQDMSRSRDTLSGGSGIDTVDYSTHIFSRPRDTLSGGSGIDTADNSTPIVDGKTAEQSEVRGWLGNRGITADLVQGRIDKFELGGVDSFDTVSDIENVTGSVLDDTLYGNAGNNMLNGAAGNDTLLGGGGFDSMTGGAGDDWIFAGFLSASEQIDGGKDFDTADYANVLGAGRSITVNLAEGWVKKYQDRTLFGADLLSNIEAVIATRYNDSMMGSVRADVLNGGAGHDTLIGNAGDDILIGGIGNDYVMGEAGNDVIIQDSLVGNDTLDGGADIDTLDYSKLVMAGASFVADLAAGTVLKYQNGVLAGRDTIQNVENIIFSRYNDQLNGSVNNDLIDGNSGNDTLRGGAGNDTMLGDRGDDHIFQDDLIGSDHIDGGIGVDTLDYMALGGASVAVDLANQNVVKYQNGANVGIDTIANVEIIRGTRNNDSLSGSIGEDVLCGDAGNDVIYGNAGNDNVVGDDGNDVVIGNDGDDILNGGNGNDVINGNAGDDTLNGGDGNDVIVGEDGNDLIIQTNRDTYHWSTRLPMDTIDGGSGIDMVDYSKLPLLDYGNPPRGSDISLEVDLAAGTVSSFGLKEVYTSKYVSSIVFDLRSMDTLHNIEGVAGTEAIDRMRGSARADIFFGNGSNDTLLGLEGKDALSGGTGEDFLSGDGGNDVLNGDAGNDTLYGKSGHDAVFGGEGNDLIVQDIFDGDDTVDGGSGIDTLDYGQGQLGSGGIHADLSAGTLLKYLNNVALSMDEFGAVIIRPIASGTTVSVSSQIGTSIGKDFVGNIENLIGTIYQDILTGSLNAETLNGGAGNDTLNGAGGNDFIMGGEGDDVIKQLALLGNCTFDGGNGNDVVDYSNIPLNGGSIQFNTTTSTVSKYKNGELVGTDILRNIESFISSPYNDAIIGNALAEKLDGRAGNDSMDGGAASDTLIGGTGNDTLNGGIGFDSVTGGEGDDLIVQNSWDDFDTLDGGNGFDTLDFSGILVAGASISVDLANGRVSKFNSANVNYTIANFEHVIATRNNDSLKGSITADILDGGAGNDTLNGGAGNDMLFGGTGNDLFIQSVPANENDNFNGGDGIDTLDYSQVNNTGNSIIGINVDITTGRVTKTSGWLQIGVDNFSNIETIVGTQRNDLMTGGSGGDTLLGSGGNDTLEGAGGNDALTGGDGNDLFIQGRIDDSDVIDGGAGNDTVDYGQVMLDGSSIRVDLATGTVIKMQGGVTLGTDTLRNIESVNPTLYADMILGSAASETLNGGAGNDTLNGRAGDDLVKGDNGDDLIIQENLAGNDAFDGGTGFDTVDYSTAQTVVGTTGGLNINLGLGSIIKYQSGITTATDVVNSIEALIASRYNDTLGGSSMDEVLRGGMGDDRFNAGAGNDTLDGETGIDLLDYSDLYLAAGVVGGIRANLTDGTVGKLQNGRILATDKVRGFEVFIGTRFNDTIGGDVVNETIIGGAGNDSIAGGAGDDVIEQDTWHDSDTIDGGVGRDLVDYSKVAFNAGVNGGLAVSLIDGKARKYENGVLVATDTLSNVEMLKATRFGDTIFGDGGNNVFTGGAGNDVIDAGAGDDTMLQTVAADTDRLYGSSGSDLVDYSRMLVTTGVVGGIHASLVRGSVRKFENGQLVATDTLVDFESLIGTQFNDTIEGNDSTNLLIAGDGDDFILQPTILAKNDTIDGGNGSDIIDYRWLKSSPGTDASISYNLIEGWVRKFENGVLVGTDTIRNIESIVGVLATGTLVGNENENTMRGSAGNDVLLAKGGMDILIQEFWTNSDMFDGGAGIDTLDFSTARSAPGERGAEDRRGFNIDFAFGRVEKFENGRIVAVDYISNIENVTGSPYDDTMSGHRPGWSENVLDGADGDDVLETLKWKDTLLGGAGNDLLSAWVETSVNGGEGNDRIIVSDQDVRVTIDGGDGIDTLDMFNSATYPHFRWVVDQRPFYENRYRANIDLGNPSTWRTLVISNIENLSGTYFRDILRGNAGANRLSGRLGNDTLDGGLGDDTLNGGEGNDVLYGDGGNDLIEQNMLVGSDAIDGRDDIDIIDYTQAAWTPGGVGNPGIIASFSSGTVQKYLDGILVGTDTMINIEGLTGTQGNDTMVGGANADLFRASLGNDVIDGGNGLDTMDYSGISSPGAGINAALMTQTVSRYRDGVVATDTLASIEGVTGTRYNDTLSGAMVTDILKGEAGDDLLNGSAGNDSLEGGEGSDTLDGGADNDILKGDAGDDLLNGSAGSDSLEGGEGSDTLDGGADNDTLKGDAGDDLLNGLAGNDSLEGGEGSDTLDGGVDNDILKGEAGDDLLNGEAGNDSLEGGEGSDTLDGGADNDILKGDAGDDLLNGLAGSDSLEGGEGSDTLDGGADNDILKGDAGDDLLNGWSGSDSLEGGEGSDTLDGGADNDTLKGYAGNDLLNGSSGNDSLEGGEGSDTLDGGADNDILNGSSGDDSVMGGDGNDTLNGGGGNDTLVAGAGNDVITGTDGNSVIVQDVFAGNDTLDGGAGHDIVDYSSARATLGATAGINASLTSRTVIKYQNGLALGTDLLRNIEQVIGSDGNDTLSGGANADFLSGDAGNDLISGAEGNDTLNGGDGADTLSSGGGMDIIDGGEGDDRIVENSALGNDTIDGGNGFFDTLDYSLVLLDVNTSLIFNPYGINANLATNRVRNYFTNNGNIQSIDYLSNIENLIGTKFSDTIHGDGWDNILTGGLGNNVISGDAGDDTFLQVSSRSNDTLDGGDGVDTVDYLNLKLAAGVNGGIRANLSANWVKKFENASLVGTDTLLTRTIENIFGSRFNDTIVGDAFDNVLAGDAGNDSLNGTAGNDTLSGGLGNDSIEGGLDMDMIDGGAGDDLIRQDLVLAFRDTIDGGEGIDTLDYRLTNFTTGTRTGMGAVGITADLYNGTIYKFEAGSIDGYDTVSNIENLIGTVFNDTLIGSQGANLFDAGAGDDWITGYDGNDTLLGGAGNDIYHFQYGFENVRVRDTSGVRDIIEIANASPDDYTAVRAGLDLKIWRTGAEANVLTIADWYSGAGFQIEEFRIGNALITSSDMNLHVSTTPGSMAQLPRTLL